MCSFLFSTRKVKNFRKANHLLSLRGPDHTKVIENNGHTFVHNLLSITGLFTPQPLVEENIFLLFNGEIYNFDEFGDYDNDSKCIIPLYKKYGPSFTKKLDGEFAITIVDYNKNIVVVSSDIFKTKPLFYALEDGHIGSASYRTPLHFCGFQNIIEARPNETLVIDMKNSKIIEKYKVFEFELTQHKDTYEDWVAAFQKSVVKRAAKNVREKIFIGISSGYDSGAIACEMARQEIFFHGYSHIGSENQNILDERKVRLSPFCNIEQYSLGKRDWRKAHKYIVKNTESYNYSVYSARSSYSEYNLKLIDDNGSNQFSYLCSKAKRDERKIHLSGQGADEIFSDYGFNGESKYDHSNFGGLFPQELSDIFPWPSFYESTMKSYLAKEEYVGGAYGIESRYPFLDKYVVQEFLWLSASLKNKYYKNVLHYYLSKNKFPFTPGEKIGF